MTSTGRYDTPNASRYLQALCKHFAHKVAVAYDEHEGWADFQSGRATMRALPDRLEITVTGADDDSIALAREIIDDHLKRFAFREGFERMDWA